MSQMVPPKSKFKVDQIPDLGGRVAIVTGGNVGIGYETIKALLQHNAKVYMASRSREKAEAAIASLKEATGKEAIFLELDLSSLASVRKAAKVFLAQEHELHILFNNAGVMWPPIDWLTTEGYDLQFGTNVLGHFYFTELLMPALLAGVESSPDHHTRVVTTSSSGAYLETLHFDTFKDGPARRKKTKEALYYQSKFGNVVVAHQLAKRYASKGIISISVNPGNIQTELQRYVPALARRFMNAVLLYPTPYGALTQLFAGTMPEALNYNGEFLIPWARLGKCRPEAYDPDVGERLWNWLDEQVKAFEASHPDSTTA
ncbi:NAD(P)-binding protein [Trametes coccinea BRFM310]|uniref:NAD(P)-binding protein n=1 Tax=Trametes coccinea (strain BRFM310) TaxID=1353009 RepID=A0A1Y2IAT0_TRAC3|nr:NAD(P)-binding protein [Trametes coccinea BRFM310]